MNEKHIFYVEWRNFRSDYINRRIFRDTTYQEVISAASIPDDIVYLQITDITNEFIGDFEKKVNNNGLLM